MNPPASADVLIPLSINAWLQFVAGDSSILLSSASLGVKSMPSEIASVPEIRSMSMLHEISDAFASSSMNSMG